LPILPEEIAMKMRTSGGMLSVSWLVLVLAAGCGGRPEGDMPTPRPATQKEMDDSAKSVADSLRQMQANDLTTAKPR
jgi:hypothetical protein